MEHTNEKRRRLIRVVEEIRAEPFGKNQDDQISESGADKDDLRNELAKDVQPIVEVSERTKEKSDVPFG